MLFNLHHSRPHEYVTLMYDVSDCYASWDPSRPVRVGDYGHLQHHDSSFVAEGNIFDDGTACTFGITVDETNADDIRLIGAASRTEKTVSVSSGISKHPIPVGGSFKESMTISHSHAAMLGMYKPRKCSLKPHNKLEQLMYSPDISIFAHGRILVSEVYTCQSFARLFTPQESRTVQVGLEGSHGAHSSAQFEWKNLTEGGDFMSGGSKNDQSDYVAAPLFKLVGRKPTHWYEPLVREVTGHGDRPVVELDCPSELDSHHQHHHSLHLSRDHSHPQEHGLLEMARERHGSSASHASGLAVGSG